MAIVKMKKLRVMAMAGCREALLSDLQSLGCVEISEPADRLADPKWAALLRRGSSRLSEKKGEVSGVNAALAAINRYGSAKSGMFVKRSPVLKSDFLSAGAAEPARAEAREIGEELRTLSGLQGEENRLLARSAGLQPWKDLDMPLELRDSGHVSFRPGVCPAGTDAAAMQAGLMAAGAAAEIYEISADRQQTYNLLICHKADQEKALEALRPYGFSAASFQDMEGTARENLAALDLKLKENREAQNRITAGIGEREKDREALRRCFDRLRAEEDLESNAEKLLTDGTIIFFEGWFPKDNQREVGELLDSFGCAWECADPAPEDLADVPVKLRNNWLTHPLNMVTEMYSLPAYNNVDPNPLMAPFFILFYGIMMADMGYGMLMMIAGWLITRRYRPKGTSGQMFSLVFLCGVSTFVFGALTGGFFGDFLTQFVKIVSGRDFALPALFTPLGDTMMILVGSLALGLVQIVAGMAISVAVKLRRGRFMDALWNEITWWVVFAGIALMALGKTKIVLYVSIAMVLVGAGWDKKGFGRITAVFGSLYNNVTGYFGDVLSYSRLMALMLAGSVIAQVFNLIATMPGNVILFLVISVIGNAINFALNLLGCYVHDLRLQCLEYFGKFYEDGGKPFRPLAFDTKYVDIENN